MLLKFRRDDGELLKECVIVASVCDSAVTVHGHEHEDKKLRPFFDDLKFSCKLNQDSGAQAAISITYLVH